MINCIRNVWYGVGTSQGLLLIMLYVRYGIKVTRCGKADIWGLCEVR